MPRLEVYEVAAEDPTENKVEDEITKTDANKFRWTFSLQLFLYSYRIINIIIGLDPPPLN